MNAGQRCRTCEHWRPLFSGEAWGVRSFVDAPEGDRERILAWMRERFAKAGCVAAYWDEDDAPPAPLPESSDSCTSGFLSSVPGTPDWPLWGECVLTELGEDAPSLARAIDGSDYMAVLRCHADFGCVQWREFTGATAGGET